jgi:hypothetical protein
MKDFRERRRSVNGGGNGGLLIGKVGSASSLSAGREQQEVGMKEGENTNGIISEYLNLIIFLISRNGFRMNSARRMSWTS